jgi:hypothetical protein
VIVVATALAFSQGREYRLLLLTGTNEGNHLAAFRFCRYD